MNKRFRVCSHDQPFLLPPSLQDWLPEDHLARFVADVMNELDLSTIYASYERPAMHFDRRRWNQSLAKLSKRAVSAGSAYEACST